MGAVEGCRKGLALYRYQEKFVIKEIAFTAYPAKDVAGLRKWYEDKLGLKFTGPYEEEGIEKYNEANVGGGYFSVLTEEWAGRDPGSASGVVFEVDDIEKTVADLRGKGLTVEDPYATPVCKITSFEDLEGNKVSLHQVTVPH
jgi:predicted enzyme related to lactoylglutathione lyase